MLTSSPPTSAPGTDKTGMDFRRILPEIRCQSCLSPGSEPTPRGGFSPLSPVACLDTPHSRSAARKRLSTRAPRLILGFREVGEFRLPYPVEFHDLPADFAPQPIGLLVRVVLDFDFEE